jgi:hypothetical protein
VNKEIISEMQQIPRDRWGYALGLILAQGVTDEVLHAMVAAGEQEFVRVSTLTDIVGLQAEDYKRAFSRLVYAASKRPVGRLH